MPADYEDITFNSGSFVYDGTEHMLELTGELPEGASVAYEIDGEAGDGATDAGAYEITAIIDGGTTYEDTELTARSEEHTSELQSLMRISYAVFCLNKKIKSQNTKQD